VAASEYAPGHPTLRFRFRNPSQGSRVWRSRGPWQALDSLATPNSRGIRASPSVIKLSWDIALRSQSQTERAIISDMHGCSTLVMRTQTRRVQTASFLNDLGDRKPPSTCSAEITSHFPTGNEMSGIGPSVATATTLTSSRKPQLLSQGIRAVISP
jgi:hypothetical protein